MVKVYVIDSPDLEPAVTEVKGIHAGTTCQWAGGRLANKAEWGYAARGPDNGWAWVAEAIALPHWT